MSILDADRRDEDSGKSAEGTAAACTHTNGPHDSATLAAAMDNARAARACVDLCRVCAVLGLLSVVRFEPSLTHLPALFAPLSRIDVGHARVRTPSFEEQVDWKASSKVPN